MNRDTFNVAASLVDKIDNLSDKIFKLQNIVNSDSFTIKGTRNGKSSEVNLEENKITTEIFKDNLTYLINTLNLELIEVTKSFEEL